MKNLNILFDKGNGYTKTLKSWLLGKGKNKSGIFLRVAPTSLLTHKSWKVNQLIEPVASKMK